MRSDPKKLLRHHRDLNHSEMLKVTSHVQRRAGEWIINTLMIDQYEVPFRFRRKRPYKNLEGQRVNLTYYRDSESVGGIELEVMKVVRVKIA